MAIIYRVIMFVITLVAKKDSARNHRDFWGVGMDISYDAWKKVRVIQEKLGFAGFLLRPVEDALSIIADGFEMNYWASLEERCGFEEDDFEEVEEINEDCEIILTEPYWYDFDEESLEEKREKNLRKYDVLYGEDLTEYAFEGPMLDKERVCELAVKFESTHRGNDYEDNYARGLVHKLLNFLEWTPRTEFAYGEVMQRLDY